MKLTLEDIDSHYEDSGDCDDYHWDYHGPEPINNINRIRKLISERDGIHENDIRITWCAPVVEYCIYIKDKWSGYVDFNEEYNGIPLSDDEFDNYHYYKNQ